MLGASKEFYEAITMITDCHHEAADADAFRPGPAGECPQLVTFDVPISRLSTLVGSQIQQIAIS